MLGIRAPALQHKHWPQSLGVRRDREGDKYPPGDFVALCVVHEPPGGLEFRPVDPRLHREPKQREVEKESIYVDNQQTNLQCNLVYMNSRGPSKKVHSNSDLQL